MLGTLGGELVAELQGIQSYLVCLITVPNGGFGVNNSFAGAIYRELKADNW